MRAGYFGAAAFEAAKSLGEYGARVKDAELRTGLTARQGGQFGFAAQALGQDISIPRRVENPPGARLNRSPGTA
jgi:hypothetical protein